MTGVSGEHRTRVLKTLRIDEAVWQETIARYEAGECPAPDVTGRLRKLGEAFRATTPHEAPLAEAAPSACPICAADAVVPAVHRREPEMVYGRCGECGHGVLLSRPADGRIYSNGAYYGSRDAGGVGYSDYERERAYRVAKAARLFDRIEQLGGPFRRVIEIGSGFGFARKAALDRGCETHGVDPNPFAAEGAWRLYGMPTTIGTLGDALGECRPGTWDLVLYDFVLEHLGDPRGELRNAARLLAPGGRLALRVPSMDAVEREVFGAAYRSFRRDHLHLFSRASLRRLLAETGLAVVGLETECTVHLLEGFLSARELTELYGAGLGPDMIAVARLEAK